LRHRVQSQVSEVLFYVGFDKNFTDQHEFGAEAWR